MPPSCQRHSTYEPQCRDCSALHDQGNHPHSSQRASRHQIMQRNGFSDSGVRRLDLDESYPSPSGGFFSPIPSSPNRKQEMDDIYDGSSSTLSSPDPYSAFITPEPAGSIVSPSSTSSSATTSTARGEGWAQQGRRNSDPMGNRGDLDFYPFIQAAYREVTGNSDPPSSSKGHKHMLTGSPLTTPMHRGIRSSTPLNDQADSQDQSLSVSSSKEISVKPSPSMPIQQVMSSSPSTPPNHESQRRMASDLGARPPFDTRAFPTSSRNGSRSLPSAFWKRLEVGENPYSDPLNDGASAGGELPASRIQEQSGHSPSPQIASKPTQGVLKTSPPIERSAQQTPISSYLSAVAALDSLHDSQNYFDERLHDSEKVVSSIPPELCSMIDYTQLHENARLGSGAGGAVFKVHNEYLGTVAIKYLRVVGFGERAQVIKAACREANQWRAAASHPNILPLLGIIRRHDILYLVSPYVRRGSLYQYIRENPQADSARIKLLTDVAAALVHLRQLGIIHGDIKALNVLVSDDENAMLCDFGLSRSEGIVTSVAQQGAGTVRWQSPELFDGERRSFSSDIWAFGMTIYEVISGYIPYYEKPTDAAVMMAVAIKKILPTKGPKRSPRGYSYKPAWDCASLCWKFTATKRGTADEIYRILRESQVSIKASPPSKDASGSGLRNLLSSPIFSTGAALRSPDRKPQRRNDSTGSPRTTLTQTLTAISTSRRHSPDRLAVRAMTKLPYGERESLTSSRNPPPSPSPPPSPHTHSSSAMPPSRQIQTVFELKIMDYGYRVSDRRRKFVKMIDLEHIPEPPSPAPGGFLPPLEKDEIAKLNEQFETGDSEDPEEFHDALSLQDLPEPEPGYYTVLYDFKAGDPAEMDIVEGSTVKCLGRGGGEGWMVAVREGDGEEVTHALVPESYLEFREAFSMDERNRAMGKFAP